MITEDRIAQLRKVRDVEAADIYDARYRELVAQENVSFCERGRILAEVEKRELWRLMMPDDPKFPYRSMDDFILRASGTGQKTAYDAKEAAKGLSHIPEEEREKIPRCNQKTLRELSTSVSGKPEVRKAAQEMGEDQFTTMVRSEYPDQLIEGKVEVRFRVEFSQRDIIEAGIKQAMEEGAQSRNNALEVIVAWYLYDRNPEAMKAKAAASSSVN